MINYPEYCGDIVKAREDRHNDNASRPTGGGSDLMGILIGIVVVFIIYKLIKHLYAPRCAGSRCDGAIMVKYRKSFEGTQYICPKCGAKTGFLSDR